MKYNLNFWQILFLPFIWLSWKLSACEDKKTWHEAKKGMERHKCNFKIPVKYGGEIFMKCDHEGCYEME